MCDYPPWDDGQKEPEDELDELWCEIQNGFMDNAPDNGYSPPPVSRKDVVAHLRRAADLIEEGTEFPEHFFHVETAAKEFPNGMTVRDLKRVLNMWPERREDGEETEVWLPGTMAPCTSQAKTATPLNPDGKAADLLLRTE